MAKGEIMPFKPSLLAAASVTGLLLLSGCSEPAAAPANPDRSALSDEGMAMLDELVLAPASAEAFTTRCDAALAQAEKMLTDLETRDGPAGAGDLKDYDALLNVAFAVGYGEASIIAEANPDPAIRETGDTCQQKTSDMTTRISLSRPVYDRLSTIDATKLDARSAYFLKRTLSEYRRAGIDKDEPTREKVRSLNAELAELSTEFNKNLREIQGSVKVTPEDLVGLPEDFITAHPPGEDGMVTITTDYPDLFPIYTYSPNEALRKELAAEAQNRAYPDNVASLRGILEKRYELATTLGYDNWAALITEDKMTGSPEVASDFLDAVEGAARNAAELEYDRLLAKQQELSPEATSVSDWSRTYLSELIRKSDYELDSQEVRKYFAFNDVRDGIFTLVQDLFDVEIKPWDGAPVWQESVSAHEMYQDGKLIGRFFLDMHPRDGKFKHAAAFPIRFGPTSDGVPVAALMCNFPAGDHTTGLMEHGQVETFLHEFGHLIHDMFSGQPDYANLSMANLEWDFIEAPSQMLENWVWDYDTLARFAKDADGNVIPPELVEKMVAARDFGIGVGTLRQLLYANVSLDYYNRPPSEVDFDEIWNENQSKLSPFETLPDVHPYASFGHLDGYSAIYYTYQWSLAISTDLFSEFEANGLRNGETARRYRDLVLAPGSSKPAAELVHDFLGRDWSPDAYEAYLLNAAEAETEE
ncbi:peptidase family M3 [Hyphomonas jannaschiana VP2]|uniref:Peptidase family M3 n=2 Tax=Hyphomonas jannaschiana TaxID=86 RepID=A0A059F6D2_9PROT|nr:peptidase family M3 [Hyphomonas jannaschiana VP2]